MHDLCIPKFMECLILASDNFVYFLGGFYIKFLGCRDTTAISVIISA